jgi:hypothetical protein
MVGRIGRMENLDPKSAYKAMFLFLQKYYRETKSDDVGGLLGGMSFLPQGGTADPASWNDWIKCVQSVLTGEVKEDDFSLKLKK